SFLRRARAEDPSVAECVVVAANFTPVPREGYRVGVPAPGFYRELLNSDSEVYGGSNMGNRGGLPADAIPWQGQPYSLLITPPPARAARHGRWLSGRHQSARPASRPRAPLGRPAPPPPATASRQCSGPRYRRCAPAGTRSARPGSSARGALG